MEPLGVFSSAGAATDLCKKLLVLCKNVKNAAAETDQLRRLIASFQKVLASVEEMRSSPNNAKLKHTHQLSDAIHEAESLLQKLVADLSPSSERVHRMLRKIKGGSIRWPFEKDDILKRTNSLERCMQVISESLQVDQTNLLLDIDYSAVLDRLPVASDAYFDSFEESSKARCLPDTRVDLLQDISTWADNPDSHAIFWLNGMAGTGKSTISRTISETFAHQNRLGASFFFKRGEADRGGLTKFFATIAADLAHRQPAFAPLIKQAIDAEPRIYTKSAGDQFKKLIVGPLSDIPRQSGPVKPLVVVVDALDECDQDKDIELLIWLFSQTSQPTVQKMKFFLTSRPELPPRLGFKKIEGAYKDLVLHNVPATIIENDISTFLKYELSSIRNDYNLSRPDDLRLPESWPDAKHLEILVKMAVPLFIFASTTCRFIADGKYGDPRRQLQRVLQYETKTTGSRLDATYLPILDQQLDGLSNREKADVIEEFRAIVGTIIVLANPLSITALSRILDKPKEAISNRLEMLHSVLSIPSVLDTPVRMLHLSFRDFLLNPETPDKTPLWVNERQAHEKMLHHCLCLLDNLKQDICDLKSPSISTVDIPSETVNRHLPAELQYCCLYWVSHLRQSNIKVVDGGPVSEFLLRHFLHWLEALSLIGRTREIIGLIKVLQMLVEPESGIKTFEFLNDAKLFTLTHADTIESWPLQTYSSALIFTPSNSILRAHFKDDIPSWISFPPLVDHTWDLCKHVLDVSRNGITCFTFSRDSTLLAVVAGINRIGIWDVDTGECLQRIAGHTRNVSAVDFSHDSTLLLSASSDVTVRICHTRTGDCIMALNRRPGAVRAAAFSHDSTLVACACHGINDTITVWSMETGEIKHELLGHQNGVASVAFSHDSSLIVSAFSDGTVRIWSTNSGVCKSILGQNNDHPAYLATFSPDSMRLAALYSGGILRFWKVDAESCERQIQFWHLKQLGRATLSHDWKYFLTAEEDTISLWRVDTEQCVQTFNSRFGDISRLAFSENSTYFAAASRSGAVGIWNYVEKDWKQSVADSMMIDKHDGAVTVSELAFSSDSSLIATTNPISNIIMVWNTITGCCIQQLKCPRDWIDDIIFSHDCLFLASVLIDSGLSTQVNIWDIDKGFCVADFSTAIESCATMTFSDDLRLLAIRSARTIDLWHVAKSVCVRTFECRFGHHPAHFLDDSKILAAATGNSTICLWQIDTGESIYHYSIPDAKIIRTAFSRDLTLMAIATISADIHIMSRENGNRLWTFKATGTLSHLEFSYDASCIAAGKGWGYPIYVWRIDNGQLIHNMNYRKMSRFWTVDTSTEHKLANSELLDNSTSHRCCGYRLTSDGRWISWGDCKLLRLPKRYETREMTTNGGMVVLGYQSGQIIILTTSTKDLPDCAHTTKTNMME